MIADHDSRDPSEETSFHHPFNNNIFQGIKVHHKQDDPIDLDKQSTAVYAEGFKVRLRQL